MKKLFGTVLATLVCGLLYSQTNTENKPIEKGEANLGKATESRTVSLKKISRYINPSGYFIGGYDWNDANTSTFKVKNANLIIAGLLYEGDYGAVDYMLQVAFAGSPKVMDAYVTYKPIKEFGLKLGQFKSPLGYENSMRSPVALEFVNYSLMSQRFIRMSDSDLTGLVTTGRDVGIDFIGSAVDMGGFNLLDYEVAILNGYKLNTTDNNKSKDIAARLMVTPIKPLSLFCYFQRGEGAYPDFDDLTQTLVPQDADLYVKMYRYGGGFSYSDKSAFARVEFMGGKTGLLKSCGGYFAAGYTFAKDWTVAGRFDYFDADTRSSNIYEINYTGGISYAPLKNLGIKLNYTYRQIPAGFQDQNCIYLQLAVNF